MFEQPFKNIVVGVDFSPYSKVVVKQAELLCKIWQAQLVLIHAIHDPVDYASDPYTGVFFSNSINTDTYVERIKKFYKTNAATKIIAKSGTPVHLITTTAKKLGHSLIVAGYKGHNPIAEFFFGSTAQLLALKSKVPVWIHRGQKIVRPERILVPHDLSHESNHSIDVVKKLSLACPATYEVMYVNKKPFPILDYKTFTEVSDKLEKSTQTKFKNLLKRYPNVPVTRTSGEVTEKIAKRSKDFDLLVMTHHNSTSLLSPSETVELIKKVRAPLLVAH